MSFQQIFLTENDSIETNRHHLVLLMTPTDKYIKKFFILTDNHLDFQAIPGKSRIKIFLFFNEAMIACTSIIVGLASSRGHF